LSFGAGLIRKGRGDEQAKRENCDRRAYLIKKPKTVELVLPESHSSFICAVDLQKAAWGKMRNAFQHALESRFHADTEWLRAKLILNSRAGVGN